jgi:CysZ protein
LLAAFVKAIEQLGDPAVRRVLWVGVGLSVLAFALVWTGVGFLLTRTTFFHVGWLDTAIDVLGGFAVLVVSWLLFPAVVSTTTGFFLEDVADAVERRHYPNLPPVRSQPLEETFASGIKFFGVMLSLNLILLPFLLIPPVFPFVFYGINGYLLGREYFELVAARRLDRVEMRYLRRRHGRTLFIAGVLIALLLTIPLVNLVAPLVGTAAMVHLFETARRETWGAPVPGGKRRQPATRGDIE